MRLRLKLAFKLSSLVAMLLLLVSLQGQTTAAAPPYCNPTCFNACVYQYEHCQSSREKCCEDVLACTATCGFCPLLC